MSELSEIKQVPYKCDKCGHNDVVEAVIKRKPQTVIMEEREAAKLPDFGALIDQKLKEREPKEPPQPKEVEVPSYLPKHFCKGKGCEGHDNKGKKRVTKKCTNCNQVAPENAGKCPWGTCGSTDFDDLDEDELEMYNSGLTHEHEHE